MELAREVFGDAIDLSRPRVFGRCFLPLAQRRGTAMAPNGHIYFHPHDYVEDFASAGLARQAWFLHELTHVWQHQQGMRVWLRGMFDRRYRYLPLAPDKCFEHHGIEQQGDIVQDYFLLLRGCRVPGAAPMEFYRSLLPFCRQERSGA